MAPRKAKKHVTKPEVVAPPAAAEPPKKAKKGMPEFKPTPEMRSIVETAIGYGLTQEQTCALVKNPRTGSPISKETLEKHFREEITNGEAVCHFEASVSLRHLIRGRPARYDANNNLVQKEIPIEPSAVYFYHKTRRGWVERFEHSGKNGGPIEFTDAKAELARRISRHARAGEPEAPREAPRKPH